MRWLCDAVCEGIMPICFRDHRPIPKDYMEESFKKIENWSESWSLLSLEQKWFLWIVSDFYYRDIRDILFTSSTFILINHYYTSTRDIIIHLWFTICRRGESKEKYGWLLIFSSEIPVSFTSYLASTTRLCNIVLIIHSVV